MPCPQDYIKLNHIITWHTWIPGDLAVSPYEIEALCLNNVCVLSNEFNKNGDMKMASAPCSAITSLCIYLFAKWCIEQRRMKRRKGVGNTISLTPFLPFFLYEPILLYKTPLVNRLWYTQSIFYSFYCCVSLFQIGVLYWDETRAQNFLFFLIATWDCLQFSIFGEWGLFVGAWFFKLYSFDNVGSSLLFYGYVLACTIIVVWCYSQLCISS